MTRISTPWLSTPHICLVNKGPKPKAIDGLRSFAEGFSTGFTKPHVMSIVRPLLAFSRLSTAGIPTSTPTSRTTAVVADRVIDDENHGTIWTCPGASIVFVVGAPESFGAGNQLNSYGRFSQRCNFCFAAARRESQL